MARSNTAVGPTWYSVKESEHGGCGIGIEPEGTAERRFERGSSRARVQFVPRGLEEREPGGWRRPRWPGRTPVEPCSGLRREPRPCARLRPPVRADRFPSDIGGECRDGWPLGDAVSGGNQLRVQRTVVRCRRCKGDGLPTYLPGGERGQSRARVRQQKEAAQHGYAPCDRGATGLRAG